MSIIALQFLLINSSFSLKLSISPLLSLKAFKKEDLKLEPVARPDSSQVHCTSEAKVLMGITN